MTTTNSSGAHPGLIPGVVLRFEIPRPPSLNTILAMERRHWSVASKAKLEYRDSVRWAILAQCPEVAAGPSAYRLRVDLVIRTRAAHPDSDNWTKWLRDAAGNGFLSRTDADAFMDFRPPTFVRGAPGATLTVRVLRARAPKVRDATRRNEAQRVAGQTQRRAARGGLTLAEIRRRGCVVIGQGRGR